MKADVEEVKGRLAKMEVRPCCRRCRRGWRRLRVPAARRHALQTGGRLIACASLSTLLSLQNAMLPSGSFRVTFTPKSGWDLLEVVGRALVRLASFGGFILWLLVFLMATSQ